MHRVVSEYEVIETKSSNIRVFVRARPLENDAETGDFLQPGDDGKRLVIKDPDPNNKKYTEVAFQFDKVFWTEVSQAAVFDEVCKAQVDHVLNGYNSCCFAYGQTSSGKTYSMFGLDGEIRGMIPRSVEFLFEQVAKRSGSTETALVCSFLEIYNDQIRDLGKAYLVSTGAEQSSSQAIYEKTSDLFEKLAGKRGNPYFAPAFNKIGSAIATSSAEAFQRPGLKEVQDEYNAMSYEIREDGEGNVFVKDLSLIPVTKIEEVMQLIDSGLKVRATHETKLNATSSRSHTVFTVNVLQRDKITDIAISGMLNLVDLAGSERLKKSESVGVRLKEALHINTSLSALGKVIMSLESAGDGAHIPYRDSKLTRVLQNSLGGNSYTTLLAAIHPNPGFYNECLSTLQFANRCRNVRNNPRVNYVEDAEDKDRRIRRLQDELGALRLKLNQYERGLKPGGGGDMSLSNIAAVLKKLGIDASIGADGALYVNGKRFTLDDLGLGGGGGGGTGGSTDDGGMVGKKFMNPEKMRAYIQELQETNSQLQQKNKERKVLMLEQGHQIQELSDEVQRLQSIIHQGELKMQKQQEDNDVQMSFRMKELNNAHFQEVAGLAKDQEVVIDKNNDVLQNASSTFKTYTQLLQRKDALKQSFEGPVRKEFEQYLAKLDAAKSDAIEHLRKQYAFFKEEKDRELAEATQKFNDYRSKKTEQLRQCEKEIIGLFEYCQKVDTILDNVEKGVFKIEQKQGKKGKSTTGFASAVVASRRLSSSNVNMKGTEVGADGIAATFTGAGRTSALGSRRPSVADQQLQQQGGTAERRGSMKGAERRGSFSNTAAAVASAVNALSGKSNLDGDNNDNDTSAAGTKFDDMEIEAGLGRVVLPSGLRPKNPFKSAKGAEFEISKKIVEKYKQRSDALDRSMAVTVRKATNKIFGDDGNNNQLDPLVEQHLRDALLTRPSTAPVPAVSETPIPGAVAPGSKVALAPIPTPRNLQRPSTGFSDNGGMGSPSFSNSAYHAFESGVKTKQPPGSAPGSSRKPTQAVERANDWAVQRKMTESQYLAGAGSSSEELASLQAEIAELKAKRNKELVEHERFLKDVSSDQTVQYIQKIESEKEDLKNQLKTAHQLLSSIKIANASLSRQLDRTSNSASNTGRNAF